MVIKLAVLSDVHSYPFGGAAKPGELHPIIRSAANTVRWWLQQEADFYVFCGDMFHAKGSLPVQASNAIWEELFAVDQHKHIIGVSGNHDQIHPGTCESSLHPWSYARSNSKIYEEPDYLELRRNDSDIGFICVPYLRPPFPAAAELAQLILDRVEERQDGHPSNADFSVFVGHNYLANPSGEPSVSGEQNFTPQYLFDLAKALDVRNGAFDIVLCGHLHDPSSYVLKANAVQYPRNAYTQTTFVSVGSGLQHGYGDAGTQRGLWLVTLDSEEFPAAEFVENEVSPRFIKLGTQELPRPGDRVQVEAGVVQLVPDGVLTDEVLVPHVPESNAPRLNISMADSVQEILATYLGSKVEAGSEQYHRLLKLGQSLAEQGGLR
jgi:predicted phosphodiesterase